MGTMTRHVRRTTADDSNLRILTKREMVALYLIEKYLIDEVRRVGSLEVPEEHRLFLVKGATSNYLWADPDRSAMNDFFEKYNWFQSKFMHSNQVARIVRDLREWGLLYNPNDPADALIGADERLIPNATGDEFYHNLIRRYGHNPTRWPDTVAFNIAEGKAQWENAIMLPQPAYAGRK